MFYRKYNCVGNVKVLILLSCIGQNRIKLMDIYRIIAPVAFVLLFGFLAYDQTPPNPVPSATEKKLLAPIQLEFLPVLDTIYLLGDKYISVSFKEQKARVIFRGDSIKEFKISSGTSKLEKGLDTPPGLFSVQSKSPLAISKQFENAELYYWVGFNGNIGFHGLKTSVYYNHLGLRPSSHGCIRIGREDGEKLYGMVEHGTPVIAYYEQPARVIRFASFKEFNPNKDFVLQRGGAFQAKMLARRMKSLYNGTYYQYSGAKIFMDGKTILRPGAYEVGSQSMVASQQKRYYYSLQLSYCSKDKSSSCVPYLKKSSMKLMHKR